MNSIEEDKLIHSDSAISITHKFYNSQVMVYVEGDDDIPFWDELFRKRVPIDFYTIEQVGGKNNLRKHINAIKRGDITNVIVACDSDYNRILYDTTSTLYNNPLIIMTHGHSIENTILNMSGMNINANINEINFSLHSVFLHSMSLSIISSGNIPFSSRSCCLCLISM